MTTAYPLAWPQGWPRTPLNRRVSGKSNWSHKGKPWTFDAARSALADELDTMGASNVVLSTNYELRLDGAPRAGAPKPGDAGIAVYFTYKNRPIVMARDAFDRAEENIRSLTLALQALRAIERHGGSMMMDKAFEGFAALPAPKRTWREVFDLTNAFAEDYTAGWIEKRFRELAKRRHPDVGGTSDAMTELTWARDEALKEIGF